MECDRCGDWIDEIPVRIGDEIYHADCAEKVIEADADYEAVMATWREKEPNGAEP